MKLSLSILTMFYMLITALAFMAVSNVSYGAEKGGSLSAAFKNRTNYLIERQGVVSSNIANATTPGYIAKDIEFTPASSSSALMPVARTSGGHMSLNGIGSKTGKLIKDKKHIRHDGNSVKLDEQMLKLSNVQMDYRFMLNLKSKMSGMQRLAVLGNR